ncbi:Set1 complex component sdc1 [Cytospora mali]|uniref:Set1 complex component sdc1 n=1 Tax=Cytospora mali TaxID=578113 RepID=A0A194VAS3_CYTMA|nr:Set1 complex component sdc1 [Valsa mali var. pyri (nom. inval.)]
MASSNPNKKGNKDASTSSPTGSFRSLTQPSLVTLKVPSDRLAQLSLNPTTPTTTTNNNTSTTMVGRSFVSDAATAGNSRAASADRTGDRVAMPTMAATHGAPTRQYLNSKVTYHVMEGMKIVAKERPADPLRVLGEFLLKRSQEIEGTDTNGSAATAPGDETKEADKNGDEQ